VRPAVGILVSADPEDVHSTSVWRHSERRVHAASQSLAKLGPVRLAYHLCSNDAMVGTITSRRRADTFAHYMHMSPRQFRF
jgi:hypothetical protein